ncbi:hypothetical protein MYA_0566 [Burkholderia sp. KJ006]|nr:hypothetical protein MYA_0566 [Burkholderia sp. KJ006]
MPGPAAQVRHVLVDIHRVTRETSRFARREFGGKRRRADNAGRAACRSIVSGLQNGR